MGQGASVSAMACIARRQWCDLPYARSRPTCQTKRDKIRRRMSILSVNIPGLPPPSPLLAFRQSRWWRGRHKAAEEICRGWELGRRGGGGHGSGRRCQSG